MHGDDGHDYVVPVPFCPGGQRPDVTVDESQPRQSLVALEANPRIVVEIAVGGDDPAHGAFLVNGAAPAPGTAWILGWDKSSTMVLDAVGPPGSLASRKTATAWTGTYSGCK